MKVSVDQTKDLHTSMRVVCIHAYAASQSQDLWIAKKAKLHVASIFGDAAMVLWSRPKNGVRP